MFHDESGTFDLDVLCEEALKVRNCEVADGGGGGALNVFKET